MYRSEYLISIEKSLKYESLLSKGKLTINTEETFPLKNITLTP